MITKKRLWQSLYVPTTNTTIYTTPENLQTQIIKVVVVNVDPATAYTLSIFHNVSGETAGNDNAITLSKSIGPQETVTITALVGAVMNSGDKIVAIASSASKINIHGYGAELVQ